MPDTDLSLLLFHVCFTIKMWSDFTNEETGLGGFKRASTVHGDLRYLNQVI